MHKLLSTSLIPPKKLCNKYCKVFFKSIAKAVNHLKTTKYKTKGLFVYDGF